MDDEKKYEKSENTIVIEDCTENLIKFINLTVRSKKVLKS